MRWQARKSLPPLVYVVNRKGKVFVLDFDGTLVHSTQVAGKTVASPALSGSELIVANQNKIESFTYSFSTHRRMAFRGGLSSPAIAEDGTIYAVDWEKNELWAF